jgi:hypothetical protein
MLGVPKKSSGQPKASRLLLSQKVVPLLPAADFNVLTPFGDENKSFKRTLCRAKLNALRYPAIDEIIFQK